MKTAAAQCLKAVNYFKEMAEALIQSCNHYKTTKVASAAALAAERQFQMKEQARLEKERDKEANRLQKQKDQEAAKQKRKAEKAEIKKKKKEEEEQAAEAAALAALQDGEKAEEEEGPRNRRGKGINELTEADAPLIKEKIAGAECRVVATVDDFVRIMCKDEPVILRLSRSAFKKVMEFHAEFTGANVKEINSVNNSFKAELTQFISEFAEKCEARPSPAQPWVI